MPLHNPLSLSGLEADLDALHVVYQALDAQKTTLQKIIEQHNTSKFLPNNLIDETRTSAYKKGIDKPILETLLLVGIVASFQKFVKVLVSDVLNHHSSMNERFSDIEESVRESYLVAAAATYRFKKSGSVRGVRVNFQSIERSIKECLNDAEPFSLEGEAITAELGNPSESTIETIFHSLGLTTPFDNEFGAKLQAEGWSEGTSDGDNTRKSLIVLSKNIERRNDAVHGMSKIVFGPDELLEILEFFRKFGSCLFHKVDQQF